MRYDMKPLFSKRELRKVLEERQADMIHEIDQIASESLLEADPEKVAQMVVERHALTPIELKLDQITVDQADEKVDVSQDRERYIRNRSRAFMMDGTIVRFCVPFDGNPELFKYKPSTYTLNPPSGRVQGNELVLAYATTDQNATAVKSEFKRDLESICKYLSWVAGNTGHATALLHDAAEKRIAERREKLLADHKMVSELGFPVRRRSDVPKTYVVPEIRRKATLTTESTTPGGKTAPLEPALRMDEYEHILEVVSNMVSVMERSPHAFISMREEDLRQHFLVQLNGQYDGNATGETFNFHGKTDILLRYKGKNLFIAECKFWSGRKALSETIDQLLGYASWRDTRTAILLFNRTKNLSKIIEKIPDTVKNHPNFLREMDYASETAFRFVLHHRDDTERELILTILVFEVPKCDS
jgi:hypothetical protein